MQSVSLIRIGIVIATATICTMTRATEWPIARLVKNQEVLRTQAPVAGGYIRGLEVVESSSATHVDTLYIPLRTSSPSNVCVDISRRDGSYGATNEYELPAHTAGDGYTQIPIETKHPEFYKDVTTRDLAIVARAGHCPAEEGYVVPVFWNHTPSGGTSPPLVIAVQSGDRDTLLYVGGKSSKVTPISCHSAQERHVASFDTLCQTSPLPTGATVLIELEACAFGECDIIQKVHVIP